MHTDIDTFGCVGHTIKLRSGRYFDFDDPRPEQFEFADIAGGLAKECRYTNQTPGDKHYSVAEHCLWCLEVAVKEGMPREVQAAVLMHDAAEAFTGDINKPLKVLLGEAFKVIERRIEACIAETYGLDFSNPFIKQVDRAMLIVERHQMWPADGVEWHGEREAPKFASLPGRLFYLEPSFAESYFTYEAIKLGIIE